MKGQNRLNKNYIIYIAVCVISIGLLIAGAIIYELCNNTAGTVIISLSSSLIASVVLAFCIELANNKTQKEHIREVREEKLHWIKYYTDLSFERFVLDVIRCQNIFNNRVQEKDEEYTVEEALSKYHDLFPSIFDSPENEATYRIKKCMFDILTSAFSAFRTLGGYISSLINELPVYEAQGYFSNDDNKMFKSNLGLILDMNKNYDCWAFQQEYFYCQVKIIYENFIDSEDFKYIKDKKFMIKKQTK